MRQSKNFLKSLSLYSMFKKILNNYVFGKQNLIEFCSFLNKISLNKIL